jgi:RNA-directed DNA polymerase
MKEPHIEGVAIHDDPESCAVGRKAAREALTGACTGAVLSRENRLSRAPTSLSEAEGNMVPARYRERTDGPARSKTRHTCGTSARENQEIPMPPADDGAAGRAEKASGLTSAMHGMGKSDRSIVPAKSPNKAARAAAEAVEGRGLVKGNTVEQNALRTQSRVGVPSALSRVRQRAKGDKDERFTALLHHVNLDRLRTAFLSLKKEAAPGADGVTWRQYGEGLEENLRALHADLHRGTYRAKPSRRVFIPKPDGRQRPLGIAALEDKIVQRALVEVMNAIYESDFLGFSYGFRPGRSPHHALDALAVGILRRKVNWVLDADIRGFFDAIDHGWLVKFIEHRIADRRVLRLIQKWLSAGVMEDGKRLETEVGSPQGATISPLLANIYLHYVLDLWVQRWRNRSALGDVIIVRYADDFIVGFERRDDANTFLAELRRRLAKFRLELQPDKTRLLAFGRYARDRRQKSRETGAPETFNFLGLTHICGLTREGKFALLRHTMRKRMTAKLAAVGAEMRRRRQDPIPAQGRWLASVLRGHVAYYGVPNNARALNAFRTAITQRWYRSLRRRGQRRRLNWRRMDALANRWLAPARIVHPWPGQRFDARTCDKSPVR